MTEARTGRCFCGAVRYRLSEEPLTLYACHCTDCQKRSGGAFGLSMWVERAALEVTQGEAVLQASSTGDGRPRNARICARCGTELWLEPENRPALAIARPAQPWFVFPQGVARYETQPADPGELISLWRARGGQPPAASQAS